MPNSARRTRPRIFFFILVEPQEGLKKGLKRGPLKALLIEGLKALLIEGLKALQIEGLKALLIEGLKRGSTKRGP
jgi:hypothetical protein